MGKKLSADHAKFSPKLIPTPLTTTLDGECFQTAKRNEVVQMISMLDKAFRGKENGTCETSIDLSHVVNLVVQNSNLNLANESQKIR